MPASAKRNAWAGEQGQLQLCGVLQNAGVTATEPLGCRGPIIQALFACAELERAAEVSVVSLPEARLAALSPQGGLPGQAGAAQRSQPPSESLLSPYLGKREKSPAFISGNTDFTEALSRP